MSNPTKKDPRSAVIEAALRAARVTGLPAEDTFRDVIARTNESIANHGGEYTIEDTFREIAGKAFDEAAKARESVHLNTSHPAEEVRIMRQIVASKSLPVNMNFGPMEIPDFEDEAELRAWTRESEDRAILSAIAYAFIVSGFSAICSPEHESLPGTLAALVVTGFSNGVYYTEGRFRVGDGPRPEEEDPETIRNTAVLTILNDPTHPKHLDLLMAVDALVSADVDA